MRSLQIGVMSSAAELNYSKKVETIATKLGTEIAKTGNVLVFSAEKDYDSLSTAANRSVKKAGGITTGFTYAKKLLLGALLPYWCHWSRAGWWTRILTSAYVMSLSA